MNSLVNALLKTAYGARNRAPTKGKEYPFVLKRREMPQPVPTKAFLLPAKTATMSMACHDYARPPPPIPPFVLVQNLSLKRIAPTDNMQPKLHDEYTSHHCLKG